MLRKNQLNLKFRGENSLIMERRNLLNRPKITQAVNIPQLACTMDVFVYYSDPICQRYLVSDGVVFAD